jgi:tetrahydromethanopterin S-methyltransferase subunit C
MDSTLERPAVDVAPNPPRPSLALVLAVLAIPGSTIAWELPSGGLWIGLPLAVAAVVLGLQARRRGMSTGRATVAIAIGTLAIGQMVVWTIASALS